ncbi:MAG: PhoH family protein [Candidatus Eisenbacteria bacterium]|nr:PhoH family protein [Candidatus Eisenbacteria bacterium]
MKKNYVLDTNVLLHDPGALLSFEDNTVVVPIYVIEEIDTFKKQLSELGRNAREVSRRLDEYRRLGQLSRGVPLENGGHLRVILDPQSNTFDGGSRSVDDALLRIAKTLQAGEPDVPVILVTKDTNLRIKADALELAAEDFEADQVRLSEISSRQREMKVDSSVIEDFLKTGTMAIPPGEFEPNTYLNLLDSKDGGRSVLARVNLRDGVVQRLKPLRDEVFGLKPHNREQYFALDALMDDEIKLVTLMGKAGSGKTLLALAAGLHKTRNEGTYLKMLVSRPIFPLGRDVGYLPGRIEEKLDPWMQPIYDNLEFLLESQQGKKHPPSIDKLMSTGILGIEPLTYIRGRSMPNQFILVDEAQNLTPLEVKTIVSRVGEGTKIVLTGDPTQIDNPYVDAASNGFNHLVQRFRGVPLAAHVELVKGERSALAELASDIL